MSKKAALDKLKKEYDQLHGAAKEGEVVYKRYETGERRRVNFRQNWQDVADYLYPRKNDIYTANVEGEKKNLEIYDSNPIKYARKLANNLLILLLNPSQKWFKLSTGDKLLDREPDVKEYLDKSAKIILDEYAKSNFYLKALEFILDLVVFGTGVQSQEGQEDSDVNLHFDVYPCHQTVLVTDHLERTIQVYRKYRLTALQIVHKFGIEILLDPMNENLKNSFLKGTQELHCIVFAVEKKNEVFADQRSFNFPFIGYHILETNKFVLKKEGFHENPYQTTRWTKLSDEEYGRGPGMDALPDIMTLNSMKQMDLQSAQLVMAPPVQGTENSIVGTAELIPWGLTFRRPGSDPLTPIYPSLRLDISDAKIKDLREDIREHFFYNQMNLIEKDRMTAVETVQRKDENLREVGSVMIRLDKEYLKPTVERSFAILSRAGIIEAPPESISKKKLDIRYTSPIAKALETEGTDNFSRAVTASAPIIQADPTVMDNIDGDEVLRDNMSNFDVNPRYLKKPNDVKAIREQRAKQQQEMMNSETQNTDADTINKLQG